MQATQSTLAESMRLSEVPLDQYNFSLKFGTKLLQVQIEITSDSLMIDAIETAIDYFVQIYYDQNINESVDSYEVYSADAQGNQLRTKLKTDVILDEIDGKSFALVAKKKSALLSILKQPMVKQSKQTEKCEIPNFRQEAALAK